MRWKGGGCSFLNFDPFGNDSHVCSLCAHTVISRIDTLKVTRWEILLFYI